MTTYLLAGGGTAGHVNPLLATADAIRAARPTAKVLVLGTREGLEARLVPERGYELRFVDKLPFPRRPDLAALRFPGRFRRAVREARRLIADEGVTGTVRFAANVARDREARARVRAMRRAMYGNRQHLQAIGLVATLSA